MKIIDSIKKESVFEQIKKDNIKYVSPYFILLTKPTEEQNNQYIIGLKVSRKNGNSVKRNFIKRRYRALLREFAGQNKDSFYLNRYYVFIGRTKTLSGKFQDMRLEFVKAMEFFKRKI